MMRGIIFSALLLAGCATTQPAIRTQIVEKPVIQVEKCVKAKDVPARPRPLNEVKPTDLETALSIALAKISEWTRYGNKTDEVLKNCV
jgi:PBP1b-binding outer membrane lipoprotein LpoB